MGWDKFEKLVEVVKRRITQITLYKMKDPRIGFITITRVELTRDLKSCKVYYTVLGSKGDISKTVSALNDAQGFIQREVAQTLRTRIMPRLSFHYDESQEKVDRIHKIIDSIAQESSHQKSDEERPDDDEE